MLLSLNWLKDFVDIPRSLKPEELGLLLTKHTVEIDSVVSQADKYANIVIGKILEINKHPNADRLQLAKVDIGRAKLEIVCGAPNIKVGQLVPVALVGATLPNGVTVEEAEVRGVKSQGMMCAAAELGLGDDHSGILILGKTPSISPLSGGQPAKVGQKFSQYLGAADVIFEVDNKSITHRPDLWSHQGLAREIAVFLQAKYKEYKPDKKILDKVEGKIKLDIKVEDFTLCPRYLAVALSSIKIEPSPKWLADRLLAVGLRPISNIVDITNYVMYELGQPLHAFDQSLVDKIIVRRAKKGEVMETLDGIERKLEENMLVIADSHQPIAIAGVMGGAKSEINDNTTAIIFESANFNFVSIRKTAQKLGLRTESSMRFEKALDPNLAEIAIIRAVELVKKLCPRAKITSSLVDLKKFKLNQEPINFSLAWLNARIGGSVSSQQVKEILVNLGFKVEERANNFKVVAPTWRATRDITIAEDIVEEIARFYGYDKIEPVMPKIEIKRQLASEEYLPERKIKNILALGAGLTEVYNYSFVSEEQINKLGLDIKLALKLANPLAAQQTRLRQNLLINLLENIKTNQAREEIIKIFEVGSIFSTSPGDINKDASAKEKLPYQEKHLAIAIAGASDQPVGGGADVFSQVKGVVEYLFNSLDLAVNFSPVQVEPSWAAPGIYARIEAAGKIIGWIAKMDKKITAALGVKKETAMAEISLRELITILLNQPPPKYQELPKFPCVIRDLAFVLNEKILYNDIREEIINFNPLIRTVELFDVYQGAKLGLGKKNLAFRLTYQAERTLTAAEVDKLQQGLIAKLEKKFGAKFRDF